MQMTSMLFGLFKLLQTLKGKINIHSELSADSKKVTLPFDECEYT